MRLNSNQDKGQGNWSSAELAFYLKEDKLKRETLEAFVIYCLENKYIPTVSILRMFALNEHGRELTGFKDN